MKLAAGQTVGIDLGTTYSAISQLSVKGEPVPLKNSAGELTTPSVVVFCGPGQTLVGPPPERILEAGPHNTIEAIKREIGRTGYSRLVQNKKMSPEFVSAIILMKLKQDAEEQIGPIGNAVITVPYYFNDNCRKATQDAGRIAGLNVLDLLNEPTAATLAYAWLCGELGRTDLKTPEKSILVYDLGGGTFDVTLVKYTPTDFRVIATDGDFKLGGLDWTRRLVDHVSDQFKQKHGCDPREDLVSLLDLTQRCEAAKRQLSSGTHVTINAQHGNKLHSLTLMRGAFERMSADLLQRTRDTTEMVLDQGGASAKTLDAVLLVGGSTRMPAVARMLQQLCGRFPSRELNADLAVAQGAAIQAAILEAKAEGLHGRLEKSIATRLRSVTTQDVNSHSLGVEVTDRFQQRRNHIMIPRCTPIPHQAVQQFVTIIDDPDEICLRLLEGEAPDADACTAIGEFMISGLPAQLPAGSPVEVTYSYDTSGRIHVAARELTGNVSAISEIQRESGLNDTGLEELRALAQTQQIE